jgi:DNA replication protein DnaC
MACHGWAKFLNNLANKMKWGDVMKARTMDEEMSEWQALATQREVANQRTERLQKFMNTVPKRFMGKCFVDYAIDYPRQLRVKMIAEMFVKTMHERVDEGAVLRFFGKPGTGKTFLSLIMCQSIAHQGFRVQYEPSLQFVRVLIEKRYESIAAYQAMVDDYSRIQFLVLDEITESVTKDGVPAEVERRVLQDVVNARYAKANTCTLIISNRSQIQLGERLGLPIADRLSENSITLIFDWHSYRKT